MDRMLTLTEAAERPGISKSAISRRIDGGTITAVNVGDHYGITAAEFERFWQAMTAEVAKDYVLDIEADVTSSRAFDRAGLVPPILSTRAGGCAGRGRLVTGRDALSLLSDS